MFVRDIIGGTSSSALPFSQRLLSYLVTNITSLFNILFQFNETQILIVLVLVTSFSQLKWIHRHYQTHLSLSLTISVFMLCYLKTRHSYRNYYSSNTCDEILNNGCPVEEKEEMWNENYYESKTNDDLKPTSSITGELYHSKGVWKIVSDNNEFKIRFRGINLPAKTPSEPSHLRKTKNSEGFYDTKRSVSFIGRPFPLDTADEHLRRLSLYGFNLLRLTVTWEAVMHDGPGVIDEEYLDYISKLVDKAAEYGFYIIVDPHQDVWSRFTGGDGAPWWTLDAAGFDTDDSSIHDSGCARLHQHFDKDDMPDMLWMTNYAGLTTATMFTLFFAGDRYAPGINVTYDDTEEEVSIQTYLQGFYFRFIDVVAEALKDKRNVLGFNSMNEANQGYVGVSNLEKSVIPVPFGYVHSAFDGMRLGSGETLDIDFYSSLFHFDQTKPINLENKSPWKTPDHDIWKKLGVYSIKGVDGERVLENPNYFSFDGNYCEEFLSPFYKKIQKIISKHNKLFVLFAEPHVNEEIHHVPYSLNSDEFAWSPHFYDAFVLMFRRYIPWLAFRMDLILPIFGSYLIDKGFKENVRKIKDSGNSLHVIVGETGIPFDLKSSAINLTPQMNFALDRTLRAMEANNLDYILWNYYAENTDADGDDWNNENLSIRANSENRGIYSIARPFVYQFDTSIEIIFQQFDLKKKKYSLEIGFSDSDAAYVGADLKLMIYVPQIHFKTPRVTLSSGKVDEYATSQSIIWTLKDCNSFGKSILTIT